MTRLPLILASAAISAALAIFYIARELIAARRGDDGPTQAPAGVVAKNPANAKVPIWVFVAILFVILPAIMWVLLTIQQ
mgnify:CR=1 FL=1